MVRWYDARQRCSLRLIGVWLRVPWKMMANFECLLVYRLMLPPEESGKASLSSWDHSLRAAKIGAATLGIGAIFAVTGLISEVAVSLVSFRTYRNHSGIIFSVIHRFGNNLIRCELVILDLSDMRSLCR